jgi:CoA:oxalate CoA-transferase
VLPRLVASADVLVENFRPGVMDRLGLGYEALKAINPALVYCAISGFGQDGPMRDAPAYDQIIQGLSGIMSITGDTQSAPLRVGYPVADTHRRDLAAFAISSALVAARTSGEGAFIDVSMLESTFGHHGLGGLQLPDRRQEPRRWATTTSPPRPPARSHRTGLLNIAANKQEQFEALCPA